jgi:hypothetical protein
VARAIIAHDNEWIAIYHREASTIEEWQSKLENSNYTILVERRSLTAAAGDEPRPTTARNEALARATRG